MRLRTRHGLTLTELLVAAVLIGIVMSGVAVWSTSVSQMRNTIQTTTYTDIKLAAAMKALHRDAQLAIGDQQNPGVSTDISAGTRTICFRQDTANTPADYSDDSWVCWYHHSASPGLRRCQGVPLVNIPVNSNADCDSAVSTRDFFVLDDINFFSINLTGLGGIRTIALTLSAHDPNKPLDSLKNPSKALSATVNPPAHAP